LAGLLSLWLFALCTGCGPSPITAKDALYAARLFIDALALLDAASKLYRSSVNSAVHTTKEEIGASGASPADAIILPKLATIWEERWTAVIKQTAELEKQFAAVETSSARYWAILKQVTGEIKDQTTRDAETAKNKQARVKWDEAHQSAKKHIETARALRDKGSDIGKTMLAAALRGQLAEYTNKLDSLASEAEQLLAALETITEEGRKIVGSIQ
jgi:hypothetical protein